VKKAVRPAVARLVEAVRRRRVKNAVMMMEGGPESGGL
jgi:hypothetical protein